MFNRPNNTPLTIEQVRQKYEQMLREHAAQRQALEEKHAEQLNNLNMQIVTEQMSNCSVSPTSQSQAPSSSGMRS